MFVKCLLGVFLIILFGFLGYKISYKYRYKEIVYNKLCVFCVYAKNQSVLFKNSINELLINIDDVLITLLGKNLDKLKNYQDVCINDKLLTNQENAIISDFFNSLGKSISEFENERFDYYYNEFNKLKELYANEYKKRCVFYTKLGILFGLFILVIIM